MCHEKRKTSPDNQSSNATVSGEGLSESHASELGSTDSCRDDREAALRGFPRRHVVGVPGGLAVLDERHREEVPLVLDDLVTQLTAV